MAPKKSSYKVVENKINAQKMAIKELGLPKSLVNKWLDIENPKSWFVKKRCQVDNSADVSLASSEFSNSTKSIVKDSLSKNIDRRPSFFKNSAKVIKADEFAVSTAILHSSKKIASIGSSSRKCSFPSISDFFYERSFSFTILSTLLNSRFSLIIM